jgi:hypothetical protein
MGALDVVAQEQGWKLVVHTKMACPPYPVTVWNVIRRDWYHECDRWRDSALHEIERLKPRVVFIGGARGYLIKDDDGAAEHDRQADGMQAMLGKLDAHSDMTILLAETPWFEQDPLECLFRDDRRCVTDRRVVLDAGYGSLEMKAAGSESAAILSVNDLLCGSSHCPFVRDGQIVYRDPHHVTSSFMEGLSPEIGDAVDAIVSGRDQKPMVADSSAWGSD